MSRDTLKNPLLWFLCLSVLLHFLWISWWPLSGLKSKRPQKHLRYVALIRKPRPRRRVIPPKIRPKQKVRKPPPKRQVRRKRMRKRQRRKLLNRFFHQRRSVKRSRKRVMRRRHRYAKLKRSQRSRLAKQRQSLKKKPQLPQKLAKARPQRRSKGIGKKKRSYRQLNLRPSDPLAAYVPRTSLKDQNENLIRRGSLSKAPRKTGAWAGTSRFARTMQAYHNRWKEAHHDASGLTDEFFGDAQVTMDRCLEVWFVNNLKKHLRYKELITMRFEKRYGSSELSPKWRGQFVFMWNFRDKPVLFLRKATGHTWLNRLVVKNAKRCFRRIKVPKRLKGKKLWVLAEASAYSGMRADGWNLLGITEERDPASGGIRWRKGYFGTVKVWANTLILRSRILD